MIPLPSRVMLVADAAHARDLPALARAACDAGIRLLEVRRVAVPGRPASRERLEEIRAVRAAVPGSIVLVNDRIDLALLAGADGAHVGQDDLPVPQARALLGRERMLGLSTHDEAQMRAAQELPLDYVALGPIFASRTKSGHAAPLGLSGLSRIRRACRLPLVAIGGIDASNAASVLAAGADAVAVASAIALGDVRSAARAVLAAVGEA